MFPSYRLLQLRLMLWAPLSLLTMQPQAAGGVRLIGSRRRSAGAWRGGLALLLLSSVSVLLLLLAASLPAVRCDQLNALADELLEAIDVVPQLHLSTPSVIVPIPLPPASAIFREMLLSLRFYGALSLVLTVVSMTFLLLYLGACNALPDRCNPCRLHHDEPCPRAVRWTYPEEIEEAHRHWFLVHVAQTRLIKDMYVSSISQYVGARGTSGAKLMLMSSTAVSLCQTHIAWLLWRCHALTDDPNHPQDFQRWTYMWLAALSLLLLGLAESAIDWKTTDTRKKEGQANSKALKAASDAHAAIEKKEADEDDAAAAAGQLPAQRAGLTRRGGQRSTADVLVSQDDRDDDDEDGDGDGSGEEELTEMPRFARTLSVYNEEDEARGKAWLRTLHMLAAFGVVGFNAASQLCGAGLESRKPSAITAAVGFVLFFVFCMMQWLSGSNDDFIPEFLSSMRASNVVYTFCCCLRRICYCPPGFQKDPTLDPLLVKTCACCRRGTTEQRQRLICASWWFIAVEVVAFAALTAATGAEAVLWQSTHV